MNNRTKKMRQNKR